MGLRAETMTAFQMNRKKRSPVGEPLPQPGESGERLFKLGMDKINELAVVAVVGVVLASQEWLRYWVNSPPKPVFVTIIGAMMAMYAFWRMRPVWADLRRIRQGIKGERAVAEILGELRAKGYRIFHDVKGADDYNIDHVLIGPGGVFAVETKTVSKPEGRDAKVDYSGERILVDGRELERDPLKQSRACADRVREILKSMTGRSVFVRPVVVFPGWWVNKQPADVEVWVLNPKGLLAFVANESEKLNDADVALFSDRLDLIGRKGQ
jgi:hypothetical protein